MDFLTMNEHSKIRNVISLDLLCYDCFKVITVLSEHESKKFPSFISW